MNSLTKSTTKSSIIWSFHSVCVFKELDSVFKSIVHNSSVEAKMDVQAAISHFWDVPPDRLLWAMGLILNPAQQGNKKPTGPWQNYPILYGVPHVFISPTSKGDSFLLSLCVQQKPPSSCVVFCGFWWYNEKYSQPTTGIHNNSSINPSHQDTTTHRLRCSPYWITAAMPTDSFCCTVNSDDPWPFLFQQSYLILSTEDVTAWLNAIAFDGIQSDLNRHSIQFQPIVQPLLPCLWQPMDAVLLRPLV